MGQERILVAHDLAGDLQNGAGALVQALDQPVGIVEAVGEVVLAVLVAGALGDGAVILVLTSRRGRVSVLSSISQPPSGPTRTKTSGTTGVTGSAPKASPGLD